jgi:TetR/AcrR family transcriptional regulator, transcriptional repressor for nem operon
MAMTKSSKATMAEASGQKLLDAAVHLIRAKGYSAARVEDICASAGLTKGAFFRHSPAREPSQSQ